AHDLITPSVLPFGEPSAVAAELHRATLGLAAQALETAHDSERHHGTMTMALSEDHLARIKARLREVEQELALLASDAGGPQDRVYQLQFQLFPVSLYTDAAPPGHPGSDDDG